MTTVVEVLTNFFQIGKAIIARCLFVVYCFVAVWRVTVALNNNSYWLLLLTLCPLALETLYTAIKRQGKEHKWITPNVLFFLYCTVPCIWLLELKLLDDRLNDAPTNTTGESTSDIFSGTININLPDETWTLALEQILIFILVLAKWIAPKGNLTLDQLSQLLLVNIAAGADIIELMEAFSEDAVSKNAELVYIVMAAWSWSLLQFTLVLTATKEMPKIEKTEDEMIVGNANGKAEPAQNDITSNREPTKDTDLAKSRSNGRSDLKQIAPLAKPNGLIKGHGDIPSVLVEGGPGSKLADNKAAPAAKNTLLVNGNLISKDSSMSSESCGSEIIEIDEKPLTGDKDLKKVHDNLRADEEVAACLQGRRCFDCFCCYNEIWGMIMSIFFQDGPFFILRMFILFHYNVVTHMNVFFTFKNIFVIILLLNRIRVVVTEDRKKWKKDMTELANERRRKKDQTRIERGLPPKTILSEPPSRRRWVNWR